MKLRGHSRYFHGALPNAGLGMKAPQFLAVGDVVHLMMDGLGEQKQKVVEARN